MVEMQAERQHVFTFAFAVACTESDWMLSSCLLWIDASSSQTTME